MTELGDQNRTSMILVIILYGCGNASKSSLLFLRGSISSLEPVGYKGQWGGLEADCRTTSIVSRSSRPLSL